MKTRDIPSPVHMAIMAHSLPDLARAIAEAANIDELDREGRTALFYAARDGNIVMVSALLGRGSDPNACDRNFETPLHFAAREYRPEVAKLLLRAGARIGAQDVHGNTPLWRAVFASRGRAEMIELLVSAGADKSLKNRHGVSPEDLAKTIANYDVASLL